MIITVEYQDKQLQTVAEYVFKNNKHVKYWTGPEVTRPDDVETHIIKSIKEWVLESAILIRNYQQTGIHYPLPYTNSIYTGGYCLVYSIYKINDIEICASVGIFVDLLISSGKFKSIFVAEIP